MARNDYYVIAYLILSYLYECLKNDVKPDTKQISHDATNISIPYGYWSYIIRHLYQDGYIEGVAVVKTIGSVDGIKLMTNFMITPKGIEYLNENSSMAKAKDFVMKLSCLAPWFT